MSEPFHFYTQAHLPVILGRKARNVVELLDGIQKIPLASIYYHTHHFLLEHHYLSRTPSNDFAYWVSNVLGMAKIGESLASIDIVSFRRLEDLRGEIVRVLSDEMARSKRIVECQRGEEFYFLGCVSAIMKTPFIANNLGEFVEILEKISIDSIYFHFFEAPLRLNRYENDFAIWLKKIGKDKYAKELSMIDPYTMTLEELRNKVVRMGKRNNVVQGY